MDIVGCRGWSSTIDALIDNRIYELGTVDSVLQDTATKLTPETEAALRNPPRPSGHVASSKPPRILLDAILQTIGGDTTLGRIQAIASFTSTMQDNFPSPSHSNSRGYYRTPDDFAWGGTEEQVIAKGSDWCSEVARVFAVLAQRSSIPCRIVHLFSESEGHVINECSFQGRWILVDPLAPAIYRTPDGQPVGIVALASMSLKAQQHVFESLPPSHYGRSDMFRHIAVSEYLEPDAALYDYGLSYCNDYYRRLLSPLWR